MRVLQPRRRLHTTPQRIYTEGAMMILYKKARVKVNIFLGERQRKQSLFLFVRYANRFVALRNMARKQPIGCVK